MPGGDDTFDYVIAGGGAAGCVLARRLLERTDGRIALIEAGSALPNRWLGTPLTSVRLGRWWHSWPFETVPQQALHGRRIALPMGRVLGGSASINAMIAQPALDADIAEWGAAVEGWSPAALAPARARAFGMAGVAGVAQLPLAAPAFRSAFSEAFLAACGEGGLPNEGLLDGPDSVRCGYYPLLQRNGRRFSAFQAYLAPMRGHPRLTVITGKVVRLTLAQGEARGVVVAHGGTRRVIAAEREVILALGALESPRVLMASGIGPADLLRRAGIGVVRDLPDVGERLADHVRLPLLFHSGQTSPARLWRLPGALLRRMAGRASVLASNCCEAGAYLSSGGAGRPDLQLITHFQSVADGAAVDIELTLVRPLSRGRVSIDPAAPDGRALIDPAYLSAPPDLERLVEGIGMVREIARRPALAAFGIGGERLPGPAAVSREALARHVRATATTAFHPVGTCRMGDDDAAVVDGRLRVNGLARLRIVDASVMLSLPAANTCCAVMLIAERAAELMT
ncbi:GMC family oxidoreductase [Ancylobacter lacus]|uniref:GMC family oxidoreductase n=1 Tax=Ancylobacter lacus TaxID=2579970 RepID=UPI001BCB0925|nr:GMC oxidoreductase [Ancylobacter lacus]MBS7538178.1 GMC family oxidoreductase N-terminal domain-containing protein [Ancylobacter lacus]